MQSLATRYDVLRHRLADGEETTVYVVGYPRPQTSLSVEHFAAPQQLDHWCRRSGVQEAIVGGFFVHGSLVALGVLFGLVWLYALHVRRTVLGGRTRG